MENGMYRMQRGAHWVRRQDWALDWGQVNAKRGGLKYKDRSQVRAVSRDQTHDTESPRLMWMRPLERLTHACG